MYVIYRYILFKDLMKFLNRKLMMALLNPKPLFLLYYILYIGFDY